MFILSMLDGITTNYHLYTCIVHKQLIHLIIISHMCCVYSRTRDYTNLYTFMIILNLHPLPCGTYSCGIANSFVAALLQVP